MIGFTKPLLSLGVALLLGTGLMASATAGEQLKTIQEKGVINIGLEGTYPPFSYQDADGKLTGFEVDLANLLAKQLGVEAKLRQTPWDSLLAALESKRLDLVVNQVTVSDERRQKYDFSKPYTISGIQALVLKSKAGELHIEKAADLAGKKVGVGLGTNYEQWVRKEVPGADVRTYQDDPAKFADLRNGRIDAILVDRLAALEYAQKAKDTQLAGEAFSRLESAIPVRKGEPELLAALNKALDALRADGSLTKLSKQYFGADVTQ